MTSASSAGCYEELCRKPSRVAEVERATRQRNESTFFFFSSSSCKLRTFPHSVSARKLLCSSDEAEHKRIVYCRIKRNRGVVRWTGYLAHTSVCRHERNRFCTRCTHIGFFFIEAILTTLHAADLHVLRCKLYGHATKTLYAILLSIV